MDERAEIKTIKDEDLGRDSLNLNVEEPSKDKHMLVPGVEGIEFIDDTEEMIGVGMGEYAVTSAENSNPTLKTVGVGPCVAVALSAPDSKVAGLMHVPAWETSEELQQFRETGLQTLIATMKRNGLSEQEVNQLVVDIVGGDDGDKLPDVILDTLSLLGVNKIRNNARSSGVSYQVALDAETGKLYNLKNIKPDKSDSAGAAALRSFYSTEITNVKDTRSLG